MSIIFADKLNKTFKTTLLHSVSFVLNAGVGMGIQGYNGCGKSTLLDILAGLQKQSGGTLTINTTIGYVMQKCGFQEGLTCLDNLRLEAALCGLKGKIAEKRVDELVCSCLLEGFIKTRADKMSAGMRGRLALALALMPNPGLLLLDEAFSALDEHSKNHFKALLGSLKLSGTAILMVSHNTDDFIGLCEYVLSFPGEEVAAL